MEHEIYISREKTGLGHNGAAGLIKKAVGMALDAEGVGVVMECHHLCMMMRGVQKQNSLMVTSAVLGSFRRSEATRNEFLDLLKRQS